MKLEQLRNLELRPVVSAEAARRLAWSAMWITVYLHLSTTWADTYLNHAQIKKMQSLSILMFFRPGAPKKRRKKKVK